MDSRMNKSRNRWGSRTGAAILVASLVAASTALGCSAAPAPRALEAGVASGPRIELRLVPGVAYAARRGFGPFGYTVQPQVAAWLETPDGRFVDTLFVTAKGDSGAWLMAPAGGRPEALPVWFHARKVETDAVSAATSTGETRVGSSLASRLEPGRYVVKLEANRSYDWNETFTKGNAGVNGQPSLVYAAEIEIGKDARRVSLVPVGQGSVDGALGGVKPGLDGITTALQLFSSLEASFLPN